MVSERDPQLYKDYLQGKIIGANTRLMGIASLSAQEGYSPFVIDQVEVEKLGESTVSENSDFKKWSVFINSVVDMASLGLRPNTSPGELPGFDLLQLQSLVVSREHVEKQTGNPVEMASINAYISASESFCWNEHPDRFPQLRESVISVLIAHEARNAHSQ